MSEALIAFATALGLVLAVELPDKTLVATLVLTTRFRGRPVFLGVCAAFFVQCVIAVGFGSILTALPETLVGLVVAAMFGIGAIMLLREGFGRETELGDDAARSGPGGVTFLRSAITSFGVLFAAEWGDASQLATAGLTARLGQPIAVGLGSFVALAGVAGIAVLVGGKVRDRIRPKMIQRVAGVLFAGFALVALAQTLL